MFILYISYMIVCQQFYLNYFSFFAKKENPDQKVEVTVREFIRNDAKYSNNYITTFL
ncbi:hypothetical protein PP225_gp24 [Streptococcus phage L5A1]|uniref:Uncharacterized protein n=1 Tax=Streptococcus phage L5A1 TaxID=2041504 RepID=A0A2P0VH90_9CAUD|nr:hypothetical protein PP225_gp24 [Streptococcus phage L5A1]ATI19866.1 hypothetical protein L5A1_024 [Streptococcus phage L5A1]